MLCYKHIAYVLLWLSIERVLICRQFLASGMMKKYNVAITEELERELEKERKRRMLDSIPETMRVILSEYLANRK